MARIRTGKAWRRQDVWPLGTTSPYSAPKTLDELYERALENCRRAWETAQNPGAIDEALSLRETKMRPLPGWLWDASLELVAASFVDDGRRISKPRRLIAQWRRDLVDLARSDFYADAREHDYTHESASELASKYFAGTRAAGSPEAMRKSYKRVRRLGKKQPGRYYCGFAAHRFLEALQPDPRKALHLFPHPQK